jgi:hypothetical protein
MIGPVVIIHVRIVTSRARRDGVVPTANMNIQGGMAFRLMSLHSRLKKRHEEGKGKGKEKEKRERGPEGQRSKEKEPQQLVHSASFHGKVNRRGCLWVREDLHNEQTWLRATLRRSWGGNALDGNLNTMRSRGGTQNKIKTQ